MSTCKPKSLKPPSHLDCDTLEEIRWDAIGRISQLGFEYQDGDLGQLDGHDLYAKAQFYNATTGNAVFVEIWITEEPPEPDHRNFLMGWDPGMGTGGTA